MIENVREIDYEQIRHGVRVWNHYVRIQRSREQAVWVADLSDADLTGADLSGADLSDTDLTRADLSDADLTDADLTDADLTDAHLSRAHLSGADLSRAYLSGAKLRDADLSGADLSGAHLSGAGLSRADLSGAKLRGADLSGATLTGADLSGADLSGADLSGAYLRGATLTGADLTDADLTGANLQGVSPPRVSTEVRVGIIVDVGSRVDPQVIVDLVRAVGVLAQLAVTVGPRLNLGFGSSGSGSTAMLTATAEGRSHEVYLSALEYRNPFSVDLVEVAKVTVPFVVGAGIRPVIKDLLKGPDKSGLVSLLFTFMSREERALFLEARKAERARRRDEAEAVSAEAKARIHQAGFTMGVGPATQQQLEERIQDTTDPQTAETITERLPDLAPLTSRPHTLTLSEGPEDEPQR
jgi:hypothetical protein